MTSLLLGHIHSKAVHDLSVKFLELAVLNFTKSGPQGAGSIMENSVRYIRAALTTHELEWLEPWGKLAELELKCSNRELV